MALRCEIVDFLWLDIANQARHRAGVTQVTVMQFERRLVRVRVRINMLEAARVESAGPANDAMNLVALGEQQLGKIRAILPSNARNQRFLRHKASQRRKIITLRQAKGRARREGSLEAGGLSLRPRVGRALKS